MPTDQHLPYFTIRKKFLSLRWYVFASLPDGRRIKVARFPSSWDAENWVQFRSQAWLERHKGQIGSQRPTSPAPA